MNVALWVVSIAMGVAFAAVGAMKLLVSKKRLLRRGAGWVEDFSSGAIRFVGFTELLGGLALLLPVALDAPPRLAIAAGAAGLTFVALGAAVVHLRRREPAMIALNIALLALAVFALRGRP
jgi:DoxX-like family